MTIRIAQEYISGCRGYFPKFTRIAEHGVQGDAGTASALQKHPGTPPYTRRQRLGDNANWPTPGQRASWWMTFDAAQMPIRNGDSIVMLITGNGGLEQWEIGWSVDGGETDFGGDTYDGAVTVAILSTDTIAQIRDKTVAAINLAKTESMTSYFPSGATVRAVDVVAGDAWSRAGVLIPGACIIVEDGQLGPFGTISAMLAGTFLNATPPGGTRTWPAVPVRWGLTTESGEEMLCMGQEPVLCAPARFGMNFAMLPIGDELPSSIFGGPDPDAGEQPDWTTDPERGN